MNIKADTAKIRRWREERHWSQEHLAELAGVSLRTVQRLESGEQASGESLKALAAAFGVDVYALSVDPKSEAIEMMQRKTDKTNAALRLSFWIHLASYVLGMVIFIAISVGMGAFVMMWAAIWWTVGLVSHAVTVVIVWLATRYQLSEATEP